MNGKRPRRQEEKRGMNAETPRRGEKQEKELFQRGLPGALIPVF
jgi:hypothetical protein